MVPLAYLALRLAIHSTIPVNIPSTASGGIHSCDTPNTCAAIANAQQEPAIHNAIARESGSLSMCFPWGGTGRGGLPAPGIRRESSAPLRGCRRETRACLSVLKRVRTERLFVLEIGNPAVRARLPDVEHVTILPPAGQRVAGHVALLVEGEAAEHGIEHLTRMHHISDPLGIE